LLPLPLGCSPRWLSFQFLLFSSMAEHYYNDPSLCSLHHDERRTQNLQKVLPPYYYTLASSQCLLGSLRLRPTRSAPAAQLPSVNLTDHRNVFLETLTDCSSSQPASAAQLIHTSGSSGYSKVPYLKSSTPTLAVWNVVDFEILREVYRGSSFAPTNYSTM
jgi:hypothetical protein